MNETPQNYDMEKEIQRVYIRDGVVSKSDWSWKDFFFFLLLTGIIVFPIRMWVAQPFLVSGESMIPTFHTGEYLVVDQLSYHLHDPERGDVIVFKYPGDPSKFFIKRVIALPGETISIDGFDIYIQKNETSAPVQIKENFIELERESNLEVTLGTDEYFVMGDNRLQSLDSRVWGPLNRDYIIGKAFIRLLPIDQIDFLPGQIDYNL